MRTKISGYSVIIEPAEEGGYWARVPVLPGCFSQGRNLEEAVVMAKEAIVGFVELLLKLGKPVPFGKSSSGTERARRNGSAGSAI